MTGTRILTGARIIGSRTLRSFQTEAVTLPSFAKPPSINWGSTNSAIRSLGTGVAVVAAGAAATLYHEYTAGYASPTVSSTLPIASAIGYQAVLGIVGGVSDFIIGEENTNRIGLKTDAQSQVVTHVQRQRMAKLQGARHVVGVNTVCDDHGIPLSATIADLFILHHEVNPEIGSPLDSAFEQLIIDKFQEEFDEGMSYTDAVKGADQDLSQFAVETNQKKLNSVSAVGVGAHTSFQMLKEFMYKFKTALADPTRVKREMHGLIEERYSEQYQTEVEAHKQQITQALSGVRSTIREHRDRGVYERHSEVENNERDNLIKKTSEAFKKTPEERIERHVETTLSFRERMQAGRAEASPKLQQAERHDEEQDKDNDYSSGPR